MASILFMGTPAFTLPILDAIRNSNHTLAMVVSQPDKQQGRKNKLEAPPAAIWAKENNIPLLQPKAIRSEQTYQTLASVKADFFIVAAYGRILPQTILDLPKFACINIHTSSLPTLRGSSPIHFAIWQGLEETAVCSMLMEATLDTGAVLKQEKVAIHRQDTTEALTAKLATVSAKLTIETIEEFASLKAIKQDEAKATYTRLLKKEDGKLDWQRTAKQLYDQYRAFHANIGVYTYIKNKKIKILQLAVPKEEEQATLPTIGTNVGQLYIANKQLYIQAKDTWLTVQQVQVEGKKPCDVLSFINGYRLVNKDVCL